MRSAADVHRVFELSAAGHNISEISRSVGIARATIRAWLRGDRAELVARRANAGGLGRCNGTCGLADQAPPDAYAYLLGQYLGDGSIASHPRHVYRLRVACCAAYPAIVDEVATAMALVLPNRVGVHEAPGVLEVSSYSKHWPCVFPQHGSGPKHLRRILLESWQAEIALARHPLRGVRRSRHPVAQEQPMDDQRLSSWSG